MAHLLLVLLFSLLLPSTMYAGTTLKDLPLQPKSVLNPWAGNPGIEYGVPGIDGIDASTHARTAQAGRALGVFPPNASRVTAKVLKQSVWPSGSLSNARPPVTVNAAVYSFTLQIESAAPVREDLDAMAYAGAVIDAFSFNPLSPELVGKNISATLERVGDTVQGSRWWISGIQESRQDTK